MVVPPFVLHEMAVLYIKLNESKSRPHHIDADDFFCTQFVQTIRKYLTDLQLEPSYNKGKLVVSAKRAVC
jgi:hypothetical protein